jgi:all-trans-8'-apo-beta-carotenal 15,15'-oxygenase
MPTPIEAARRAPKPGITENRYPVAAEPNSISSLPDLAPGIEAIFPDDFQECDSVVEPTGNKIPDFLQGTYYLNGPARFGLGNVQYRHWLDGDGMVSALRFDKDSIRLKSRYVRSRKFAEEQEAGRALFRTFGTAFADSRLNRVHNGLESPVNVSVYPFAGRLLAFGEQGLPWELDPDTLATRGQFNFGGRLNEASPFAAHPKFDLATGEMFNFGIFFSAQSPKLYFYCFGPQGLRYRTAISLEYPCSVHDFSLGENYAVFYLSPYVLNTTGLLREGRTVIDCLEWRPERGSRLVVITRKTGELFASISLGARYCLHLINTFEEGGQLTVDVLEFDEPLYSHYQPVPALFQKVSRGGPVRLVIDLRLRELVDRIALDFSQAPDFPAINPQCAMHAYEEFWMLGISAAGNDGRKFFDQLVRANWNRSTVDDIYQCPPMRYLGGEPVFVGNSHSNEGVIICQEFDARDRQSCFLIFKSRNIAQGPITRIPVEHLMHLGFHAAFKDKPGAS